MTNGPESNGRDIAICTFIGFQPAAIAQAVVTWKRHRPHDRVTVVGFATREVQQPWKNRQREATARSVVKRLQGFLQAKELAVLTLVPLEGTKPEQAANAMRTGVHEWLSEHPDGDALLFVDPGPSYMIAAASAVDTDIGVLTQTSSLLGAFAKGEVVDLAAEGLALEDLLLLYDLEIIDGDQTDGSSIERCKLQRTPYKIPEGSSVPGVPIELPLAIAKNGKLHVLIGRDDTTPETLQKSVQRERATASLLNGLQPVFCVVSKDAKAIEHAEAKGYPVIREHFTNVRLNPENWLPTGLRRGQTTGGRHRYAGNLVSGLPPSTDERGCDALLTFLGIDPTPTLISIFTHRPKRLILAHDTSTQMVNALKDRFTQLESRLPCNELEWFATDSLGNQIESCVAGNAGRLRADVSPGRNLYSARIGRALRGREHALWSIDNRARQARQMFGEEFLPLQGPDILTLAAAFGAVQGDHLPVEIEHLIRLGELVASSSREDFKSVIDAIRHPAPHSCSVLAGVHTVKVESTRGEVRLSWSKDGHDVSVAIPTTTTTTDHWFERIVAACFRQAGADEVVMNLSWRWSSRLERAFERRHRARPHRREIDVVAKRGHRYFAVSCKTSPPDTPAGNLNKDAVDAADAARHGLGRFAIPVLVRPWLGRDLLSKWPGREAPAELLDLCNLLNPGELRDHLERFSTRRSPVESD